MARYYDGYDWDVDGFPGEYVYGDDVYVDDYYMDERWKRVVGAPGYWISTKARVWSSVKQRFIEGHTNDSGYTDFSLNVNGFRVHKYLHRMLGEAFIPNPYGYPEVRHLDDNPFNNDLDNLAWGTQLHNVHDCIDNGHFRYFTPEDIERANSIRRTPIVAIRFRDGKVQHFISQQEASRQLGINQSSINGVLRGKSRGAGGYYFVFERDFNDSINYANHDYQRRKIPVKAINVHTGEIRTYPNARAASRDLCVHESSISTILRGKIRSSKGWTFDNIDLEDEYDAEIY